MLYKPVKYKWSIVDKNNRVQYTGAIKSHLDEEIDELNIMWPHRAPFKVVLTNQ